MKRRAVHFLLCLCFCFSTLSSSFLGVSAASDNILFYEYDNQGNIISEYYTYHQDYDIKKGYSDTLDSDRGPMMFASSKQLYSWNPSTIDWASFPSHIRAIAYSPYSNISMKSEVEGVDSVNFDYYRAPFIMISSDGIYYTIRAGWDVGLWYRSSTGSVTIGFNNSIKDNFEPILYKAKFKCSDNSVVSDWSQVSYDTWGTSGLLWNFPGSGINVSDKLDVFTYGANADTGNAVLRSVRLNDTEQVSCAPNNSGRGILDQAFSGFTASAYNAAASYITSFTPSAPNSYTVTASSTFGLNSTILTGDKFLFHEDLPYGKDTLVIAATINDGHTYQLLTDSNADVVYLRNWNWSNTDKLRVTLISSAPIYRVGYNSGNGGNVSMNSASGLTLSDQAPGYSGSDIALDKIIQYYVDKGYHFYSYSYTAGNIALTITNNSSKLNIDNSLSFPHSFAQYPNADTLNKFLMDEQNALIQEGNETNKSIWETLKSLPSNIAESIKGFFTTLGDRISGFFDNLAEKIKSFFLPSEGFFDSYTTSFREFFSDRLGILYEVPDLVVSTFQRFIDFSPAESGYLIHFPEVILPVLDNGEWSEIVLINESDISFDFLDEGPFATLYGLYRSLVWMIFIFALINLIIRKSERIFGGGS